MDPLAEDFPNWNPYHYVHNNPINLIDPTEMSAEGVGKDDWFVQRETGAVVFAPNQSTLSQEVADGIGVGDATKFDRLGADDMFGDNYPRASSIQKVADKHGAAPIENPVSFMSSVGYVKAENVRINETEYIAGGRMGDENFKGVTSDLQQIGNSRTTYSNKSSLNSKTIVDKKEVNEPFSSTKNITYDLIKLYGQSNKVTAEYHSNKGRD